MPCFGMYIKYLRGFKGGIKSFMWEVGVGKFDRLVSLISPGKFSIYLSLLFCINVVRGIEKISESF